MKKEKRYIVNIDETYLHKIRTALKCWQSDGEIVATRTIGKAPKLIFIHGGGGNGFVTNALEIWQSNNKKSNLKATMMTWVLTTFQNGSHKFHCPIYLQIP